jgi:hypothetical protein
MHRVLHDGGELHIADCVRASRQTFMRLAFHVQVIDGFDTTRDSVTGRLSDLIRTAGQGFRA